MLEHIAAELRLRGGVAKMNLHLRYWDPRWLDKEYARTLEYIVTTASFSNPKNRLIRRKKKMVGAPEVNDE